MLKPPFSLVVVTPSRALGAMVLDALDLAGKHLDTMSLTHARDSEELAIGVARLSTIIASRSYVRRVFDDGRRGLERLIRAFPKARIRVGRVWEKGLGYALIERGEVLRFVIVERGDVVIDEGELLPAEPILTFETSYDEAGDPLEELLTEDTQRFIAAWLGETLATAPGDIDMDVYEGP